MLRLLEQFLVLMLAHLFLAPFYDVSHTFTSFYELQVISDE